MGSARVAAGLLAGALLALALAVYLGLGAAGVVTIHEGAEEMASPREALPGHLLLFAIVLGTVSAWLLPAAVKQYLAGRPPAPERPFVLRLAARAIGLAGKVVFGLGSFVIVGVLAVPVGGAVIGVVALLLVLGATLGWERFHADRGWRYGILIPWLPLYMCGFVAPSLAVTLLLARLVDTFPHAWPLSHLGPTVVAWLDVIAGYSGIVVGLVGLDVGGFWRLRLARQVDNLPTSTVRGAALGLAEFKGVARPASGDAGDSILWHRVLQEGDGNVRVDSHIVPFYLEDATGRILVDPTGAEFRSAAATSQAQLGLRVSEIVLTQGAGASGAGHAQDLTLRSGDPVYLIGSVELREDAPSTAIGPDALVVRARKEQSHLTPTLQLLFLHENAGQRRDIHNVFFLSDTSEHKTRSLFLRGFWLTWAWSLVWVAASLWMIGVEQPRAGAGHSRWSAREIVLYAPPQERARELLPRLRDPSPRERRVAVENILKWEGPAIPLVSAVLACLEDPAPQVSDAALNVLWPIFNAWGDSPPPAMESTVSHLLRFSRGRQKHVRYFAVVTLGRIHARPAEVIPVLREALTDPDARTRAGAVDAIRKFGPAAQGLGPAILPLLNDEQEEVRRIAGFTLQTVPFCTEIGPAELRQLFGSRHREVRASAVRALAKLDADPEVIEAIRGALDDPDAFVRESAAVGLGELGGKAGAAVPSLVAALADPSGRVRFFAVAALGKIGPAASPAVPSLLPFLDDRDRHTRHSAAEALVRIGTLGEEARAEVEPRLGTEKDEMVRLRLKQALEKSPGRN